MCYVIYVSTTSPEALDRLPGSLYRFMSLIEDQDPAIVGLLAHPYRWYLECQYGGCSCHFRHLGEGGDLDFSPPEDWCPEDPDDIEATAAVYDVLEPLVAGGYELDLIDAWNGTPSTAIRDVPVSLREVPRDRFRFFENHRFLLTL